ncbi:hypothetical protein Lser_V15G04420 [Lactuca serriola]
MVGFHLPEDPYFANQGNGGWLDEETEENLEIPLDDAFVENSSKDDDSVSEAYNPPPVAQNPNPRQNFQGPTPLWVINLERWSNEDGQNHPYQGDRTLYNLDTEGSAEKALSMLVCSVARNDKQRRVVIERVMQVDAASGINTIHICNLEHRHNVTMDRTYLLQRELAAIQAEVRELQKRQITQERRMYEIEWQLAQSRAGTSWK